MVSNITECSELERKRSKVSLETKRHVWTIGCCLLPATASKDGQLPATASKDGQQVGKFLDIWLCLHRTVSLSRLADMPYGFMTGLGARPLIVSSPVHSSPDYSHHGTIYKVAGLGADRKTCGLVLGSLN